MDEPDGIMMIRTGLDDIIKAASVELCRLQDTECRSPRDKVGVYVAVHKLIVDGLSSLPSIPMKKDGIPTGVGTVNSSQDEQGSHEVEMSDTLDRTGIHHDPVTMDRTLPMSSPFRPVEKDRPSASDLLDAIHTNLIDPPALPAEDSEHVQPQSPDLRKLNLTRPNSSSADLILPILIYLIIKSNPNRLKSNLNYVNRFRYQRLVTGETDYCLVNFNVSCEFIKNFSTLDGRETNPTPNLSQTAAPRDPTGEVSNLDSHHQIGKTGYGTFPSTFKDSREKSSNNTEVEEAFMAASRAVGGVLLGGYQKVISGSLLDASVAKLGLTGGARSAPRTLEDVKKLIASGSGGRRENNMSSWSSRVGLLRRNINAESSDSSHRNSRGIDVATSNASNAVTRLSSLFQNSPGPSNALHNKSDSVITSQSDDDRVSIGQRLSSLPGLARLGYQSTRSKEVLNHEGVHNDEVYGYVGKDIRHGASERSTEQGPIERFERCELSDQLLMSDIPTLLADYQRLSRIGRAAGIW